MHIHDILNPTNTEILIKIVLSIVLGSIIGIERELTNKWAGLRTNILVCLGSAVFTLLSIHGFPRIIPGQAVSYGDPARIAAQILTGIGFIGGGTVLRHGVSVYGLTTAATLWVAAGVGMAVGTGSYTIAFITSIITVLILVLIRKLEVSFLSQFTRKGVRLKVTVLCNPEFSSEIIDDFYDKFSTIIETSKKKSAREEEMDKLAFIFDVLANDPINQSYKKIQEINNITSLTIQQVFEEPS